MIDWTRPFSRIGDVVVAIDMLTGCAPPREGAS